MGNAEGILGIDWKVTPHVYENQCRNSRELTAPGMCVDLVVFPPGAVSSRLFLEYIDYPAAAKRAAVT